MEKRPERFLNMSLVLVSVFCVLVFAVQTLLTNSMGINALRQLGVFYMSGISEQVSAHFGTIIDLRLSQVETLVNSVPPGRTAGGSAMQINLSYSARSAGFEYLAFYTEDGGLHMLYGSQLTADVPEALERSVHGGEYNVFAGTDAAGTPVLLVGLPAVYPMDDGGESVALVAGLPTSYLANTLETNIQSSFIEYAILRTDGSYVLRNTSTVVEESNYFDRIANHYETYAGKTPAVYAQELHSALNFNTDYTSEVIISGEHWNVYCTALPNSDWHLLLKISHSTLDETVSQLQKQSSAVTVGGGCLIILALLLVFAGYHRQAKLQMRVLDDARKTAEEAKLSAERSNRAKNEFLSNMSHDIRTPMNGIMGMTAIAIGNLDDPSRVRSCLQRIHVSSRHLLGLINDMLDMSKIESGSLTLHMEPLSLREIMENILTIIQPQIQEKNQTFHIYVHNVRHENLCSDRVRLSQILLNILGNAIKYTQEGGTIEASLYEDASPKGEGYVRSRLHIADNGIGMSKAFQARIFEPFAREDSARVDKAEGAGMGLTITKYIVDAMGGTITVESEQGKGSCFCIAIDMEKAAHQEKLLQLPSKNVLVADGDATAARLAVDTLQSIGLQAAAAGDIAQAVQLLEQRQGTAGAWQLVLLDQDLAGQQDLHAVQDLTARFGVPVMLLASGQWDGLEARAEASGAAGILFKPLFRSGLYYGLRPFLETAAPAPPPEEGPAAGLAGTRILLAEDNELNREIASDLLGEYGLLVEWAENGRLCVEMFEASAPGWYDAILMDLRMPQMTGFEASRAIRALHRPDAAAVPIIAVSADAFEEDIQKCLASGMNAHTPKPLEPEKLLQLLSQYLH